MVFLGIDDWKSPPIHVKPHVCLPGIPVFLNQRPTPSSVILLTASLLSPRLELLWLWPLLFAYTEEFSVLRTWASVPRYSALRPRPMESICAKLAHTGKTVVNTCAL